jgi:hypothetical protein
LSSQHKAPLAAFVIVSIACIVVVVNALRSDALSSFFANPTQVVVAGARLIPEPQDILAAEAAGVADATVGLAAAPHVARHVVSRAAGPAVLPKPQHRHHRASSMTASTSAVPPVVPTPVVPITAPGLQPAAPSPVSGSSAHAHGGPGAVAGHALHHLSVMHVSSYGIRDHLSVVAPYGHREPGLGLTKPKSGEHLGAWGHWLRTRAGRQGDRDHGSSRDGQAHGNDGRGHDWSHDSSQQGWSRGSSHADWARESQGRH